MNINNLRYLIVIFLFHLSEVILAQTNPVAEQIKNFYIHYMEAVGVGDRKIENGLVKDYLTPEMQKKLYRLITVTGSDPLLRAQDVSDYGIQSLTCRHLEGKWYEVSYLRTENDTASVQIPIRVDTDANGKIRIVYVTPYWGGNKYGDQIFDVRAKEIKDDVDGGIFVETFFKAYVYPYVTMSTTMEQDINQLRKTYCTAAMQKKYAILLQKSLEDENLLDPMIGCADFDAFWYKFIKISSLGKNCFMFSYNNGIDILNVNIKVSVKKLKGKYRISDLKTE